MKRTEKKRYNKIVSKYVTGRRILIGILLLVVSFAFLQAFKGIILFLLFLPLAKYSVKVTAFVPHVTLEQYTSSTILLGYMYGPLIGGLSGLILGLYGYLSNSISKFLALANVLVSALTGVFIGIFKDYPYFASMSFTKMFVIGIIFFDIIAYLMFRVIDPDQFQNVVYRISHLFINGLISVLFFSLIYNVVTLI